MFEVRGRRVWGLQTLQVVHLLSGFHITSNWKHSNYYFLIIIAVYGYISDLYLILHYMYYAYFLPIDFAGLISICTSFSCLTPVVFSIYLKINKLKLNQILNDIQTLLQDVEFHSEHILRVISKQSLIFLLINVGLYLGVSLSASFMFQAVTINNQNSDHNSTDNTLLDAMYNSKIFPRNSVAQISSVLFATLQNLKRIGEDVLIFTILRLISEEMKLLRKQLQGILHDDVMKLRQLTSWINRQRHWARVLGNFNKFISKWLVFLVIVNVFTMCFSSFFSLKIYEEQHEILLSLGSATYSLVFLMQNLMYCYEGGRIRHEGNELRHVIHRSNWLCAHSSLVPGLALVAADCKDSFVVRGGPFFILSLEFFASVMGAVITYIVILLQSS